jgi:hypothetical protein
MTFSARDVDLIPDFFLCHQGCANLHGLFFWSIRITAKELLDRCYKGAQDCTPFEFFPSSEQRPTNVGFCSKYVVPTRACKFAQPSFLF